MLTATYTLVALSVEQTNVRLGLQSLQHLIDTHFLHQNALSAGQVDIACDAVKRLCDCPHWRKLDMFLIPAIRNASLNADAVLQNLDELGRAASAAVGDIAARLGASSIDTSAKVSQFCGAIDAFASATMKRIELEDQQLFPLARSVISGEAWFSIANQMLAHDAYLQDCKGGRQAPSRDDAFIPPRRHAAPAHLVV